MLKKTVKLLVILGLILTTTGLHAEVLSQLVTESDMPQIYKQATDIEGISESLRVHGVVIIKDVYDAEQIEGMRTEWKRFARKFYAHINDVKAPITRTEYETHFLDGVTVNKFLTFRTDEFFAYQIEKGRYEIQFNDAQRTFLEDEVLRPLPMRAFLKSHFDVSELFDVRSSYKSFYGLLPSFPGNQAGKLHRDTMFLEKSDIDGDISVNFKKGFYFTSIAALGNDNGSTEFYLGSHRMTGVQVKEQIASKTIQLIRPTTKIGDIKLFDGRIGHRGLANPEYGEDRIAIFGVHHASWYVEH